MAWAPIYFAPAFVPWTLGGIVAASGLVGGLIGFFNTHHHKRDGAFGGHQQALFLLNNTGDIGLPHGSPHSDIWKNGLQVLASRDEDNSTASFAHLVWEWEHGGIPGIITGFPHVHDNGLMGGDFSIPFKGASEPLTGTWLSVHDSADNGTKDAFNTLMQMTTIEKQAANLESMLAAIAKANEGAKATVAE